MRRGTDRQTDTEAHKKARDQYTFRVVYDSHEMQQVEYFGNGQCTTNERRRRV